MRTLLFTLVFFCIGDVAIAQDFSRGLDAMKRGDHATALREWKPLAEAGDAFAQFNLGVMHDQGLGVAQDHAEARKWFKRSANQGNAQAQATIAIMYEIGQGGPQDYVEAYKWASLAERQGTEEAANTREILETKMTPAKIAEAQRLVNGWVPGTVTKKTTPPQTVALPTLVQEAQGHLNALGLDAGPVDGVVGSRTEAAIRQFQTNEGLLATGLVTDALVARLQRSVEAKKAQAKKQPKIVTPVIKRAARPTECDTQAAHPGDKLRPAYVPGVRFEDIDIALALDACEKALARKPGDPRYQYQFARALHKAQRYGEAATLYEKAGGRGVVLAQKSLGFMYANGLGVPKDYTKAAQWHHEAAEQGDVDAQRNLGFLYAKGLGVGLDYVQAHLWYTLAARQGNKIAAKNRDLLSAKMSVSQIADAERLTQEWLDQHPK